MNSSISNLYLGQFSEFVAAHMGLHFPSERWPDLRRGIRNAAPEFGFANEVECVQWLMSAPLTRQQIEILAGNLTVGETYFFREKRVFEVLTERIVPEMVQSRRGGEQHLRFWSGMDEYAILARAMTAAEVRSVYELGRSDNAGWRTSNKFE